MVPSCSIRVTTTLTGAFSPSKGTRPRSARHVASAETPGLGIPRERQPGGPLTAPWVGYGGNPAGGRPGKV
jgi:hypothetical protein